MGFEAVSEGGGVEGADGRVVGAAVDGLQVVDEGGVDGDAGAGLEIKCGFEF